MSDSYVFDCPHCRQSIKAESKLAGKQGTCPYCQATIIVPADVASTPPPPPVLQRSTAVPTIPTASVPPATPHPPKVQQTQPVVVKKTNGMAITGLVLGIVSVLTGCFGLVLGTIGIIYSFKAMSAIDKQPNEQGGRGLAIAGLVTSIVGVVVGGITVLIVTMWIGLVGTVLATFAEFLRHMPVPPK